MLCILALIVHLGPAWAEAGRGEVTEAQGRLSSVFLIYGVKRGSGGDGSQSFGPIWYVSGPKMVF